MRDFVVHTLSIKINLKENSMAHKKKEKEEASDASASASEASSSDASASKASSSDASSKKSKKSKHKSKKEKKVKEKTDKKSKKSSKPDKKEKKDKKSDKKSSKSSKSSKRGPRGVQWLNWKIPYQENSCIGQAFMLASKKGGVDLKKLEKSIKGWKGTPAFMLRKLRKGHSKGFKWDVDDSHGRLRILNTKLAHKNWKKAA
jgi:hypothetical protein